MIAPVMAMSLTRIAPAETLAIVTRKAAIAEATLLLRTVPVEMLAIVKRMIAIAMAMPFTRIVRAEIVVLVNMRSLRALLAGEAVAVDLAQELLRR